MGPEGITVCGLGISYGATVVLSDISLSVPRGSSVAIMGPSGSGKSSLLACLAGLQKPTTGVVQLGNVIISELNAVRAAEIRRRSLGLMFQAPELLSELSVVENVAVTLLFDGVPRRQALALAIGWLERLGLAEHAHKRIDEISGGEAQRVAIARALVRPEVAAVIADEPTASLDEDNATLVTRTLLSHARGVGAAVVVATHDPAVARRCDATLTLRSAELPAA